VVPRTGDATVLGPDAAEPVIVARTHHLGSRIRRSVVHDDKLEVDERLVEKSTATPIVRSAS
jgi:hypothetical protein